MYVPIEKIKIELKDGNDVSTVLNVARNIVVVISAGNRSIAGWCGGKKNYEAHWCAQKAACICLLLGIV